MKAEHDESAESSSTSNRSILTEEGAVRSSLSSRESRGPWLADERRRGRGKKNAARRAVPPRWRHSSSVYAPRGHAAAARAQRALTTDLIDGKDDTRERSPGERSVGGCMFSAWPSGLPVPREHESTTAPGDQHTSRGQSILQLYHSTSDAEWSGCFAGAARPLQECPNELARERTWRSGRLAAFLGHLAPRPPRP